MKNLSFWARENRVKTITILVILHFILWWIYYFTGAYLYLEGIVLPTELKYVGALLFFTALLFHPIKNIDQGVFKNTFGRRKFWQCIALSSVAVFTILFGNHQARNLLRVNQAVEFSTQTIALDIKKNHAKKKLSRKERRKMKRTFRKDIRKTFRKMRKANKEYTRNEKVGIVILTLLVATVILFFLTYLSCSIICSGSPAFGNIVLFGGVAIIIFGIIQTFRKYGIIKSGKKPTPANGGG